jgi:serine/threonine protein kinase
MRLGPYEVVASIARVAWAEVYKARDTRLDRIVAIKVSKREVQRTLRARGTGGGGIKQRQCLQGRAGSTLKSMGRFRVVWERKE